MTVRVQVLLSLAEARRRTRIDSVGALGDFFASCDRIESGHEPDREDHLRVIRRSRGSGEADA
jgi:hypothetical protein